MSRALLFFSVAIFNVTNCQNALADQQEPPLFQAGAFAIDVTPTQFPVIVNGGMSERTTSQIRDRLHARCIVIDDGQTRIAIAIVDNCMMPRDLIDEAKLLTKKATGIPTNRILIAATHTHTAPSVMGCLGSSKDEVYSKYLPVQIAKGIQRAQKNLQSARIGWAVEKNYESVFNRRYLMKPGTARTNRFSGKTNDLAQMNPGFGNPNKVKRTGTVDPDVSIISLQTRDGQPIAILGNYSTHYAGSSHLSADYFAVFAEEMKQLIKTENQKPEFVGIMSNGTSGDTNCIDFDGDRSRKFDMYSIGKNVAKTGFSAYQKIEQYYDWAPIVMAQTKLTLDVRMPTAEEVKEAKEYLKQYNGRKPKELEEIYARETVLLSELPPTRELILQAIRIGDLGITSIPNEVYTATGLAIKAASPFHTTFTIELANGAEGYIPTPEQHKLGGYTTWRARTSLLEEQAEPKIRKTVIELLHKVHQAQVPRSIKAGAKVSRTSENILHRLSEYRNHLFVASPTTADQSLNYLKVAPGYKVEVAACEPLIEDPVAFDWSEDGRLWVVEMRDYPQGLDGKGKPGGRIKVLTDTDKDGKFDQSTLYADNLSFPNGILCWKDGILVTSAPNILFLPDLNHDDKADKVEILYSGFTEGNPQLRINGLRWGLDNWVYCANGISSVDPVSSSNNSNMVAIRGRDLRINPTTGQFEALTGRAQFGRNRDDFGNWFGCSNARPMWHYVLEDRYLSRNPYLKVSETIVDVTEAPGAVFPIARRGIFFHESQVGRHTSANSAMIYRDDRLFGKNQYCFISEPVNNLIHREQISRVGPTFTSNRIEEEQNQEFLASYDSWFRPNMMRTGPDGALWIADIYREVIDHPQYVPKDRWPELDFRSGEGLGRIYKIVLENKDLTPVPNISNLEGKQLVDLLKSSNGTVRDMVQKKIVLGKQRSTEKPLRELLTNSNNPKTQVQILWTLQGLGLLNKEDVLTALEAKHSEVIRNGLVLSEFSPEDIEFFVPQFSKLILHPQESVQIQLALSLGEFDSLVADQLLADLGNHIKFPIIIDAWLSSIRPDSIEVVLRRISESETNSANPHLSKLLSMAIRMDHLSAASPIVAKLIQQPTTVSQLSIISVLSNTLASKKSSIAKLLQSYDDSKTITQTWNNKLDELSSTVQDSTQDDNLRIAGMNILIQSSKHKDTIIRYSKDELFAPHNSSMLQQAAITNLAKVAGDQLPNYLLENWKQHTPSVRDVVVSTLLSRKNWTIRLLQKIETDKQLRALDINPTARQRLTKSRDADIQNLANQIFKTQSNKSRQQIIDDYLTGISSSGNPTSGKQVFKTKCSTCHQLNGEGFKVGPDLKGLTTTSAQSLITSILDPNRSADVRYLGYNVLTESGKTYSGILTSETGSSLVLLLPSGKQELVPRSEIEEIQATGTSLMPSGFEKDISKLQMNDLIAYLSETLN